MWTPPEGCSVSFFVSLIMPQIPPQVALFTLLYEPCTVNSTVIDEIDREIIAVMREDGRISIKDLGQRVGLSANATGVRVNRLLADGVVTGVHAQVDHAKLGRGLEAYVDCWLNDRSEDDWDTFERHVAADDRVLEAVHLTGKVDFRLRVVVESPTELDVFLRRLRLEAGVAETDSRLILRTAVSRPVA
jgi:Lrp/AsnC family leucine-responsive transcriptional regulator